jgi:hypothetical protein
VTQAGWEETAIARPEFARLTADLGVRAAFQHVTHLLDARMTVRQGAFAFFDHPQHDLEMLRSHPFGADQAVIRRSGVVGGMVRGDRLLAYEKFRVAIVVGHGGLTLAFAIFYAFVFDRASRALQAST